MILCLISLDMADMMWCEADAACTVSPADNSAIAVCAVTTRETGECARLLVLQVPCGRLVGRLKHLQDDMERPVAAVPAAPGVGVALQAGLAVLQEVRHGVMLLLPLPA